MKQILLAGMLSMCLFLSGCVSRDMEEQLPVIILGVDRTEDSSIRISVKVPSNSASGGGEQAAAGGEQMGYLLLEATGKRFPDAVNLLRATTPRTLNFSQTREVVFGEKAAMGENFSTLLYSVYSLPRMRSQAALIICRDQAYDFTKEQKPYVGSRLSRYVDTTLRNYAGKGFVPTTTLGQAVRDLGYGFSDALLIYGSVNQFDQSQSPSKGNVLDVQAGNMPRKSVNAIELFGAATTNGVQVSGVLTGYEMALVHLLQGNAQSLDVQTEDQPAVPVFARVPATLSVDLDTTPITLKVQLLCEGRYYPGYIPETDPLIRTLTRDLKDMIAHLQQLRCDGLGFGNLAARQCLTVSDWENLHFRELYAQAQVDIQVQLQLREY